MQFINASFPAKRSRRLRRTSAIRDLVTENQVTTDDLIWPIFIREGVGISEPIISLPGVFRYSIDLAVEEAQKASHLGIKCIAIFPCTPKHLKTPSCEEAWNENNLVNTATRAIKKNIPKLIIMLDVALDPYNSLGHDGLVNDGKILNDETLEALKMQSIVQAQSGADILGPSDMMDGRVSAIRNSLEQNNFKETLILCYSAKYASAFYGPFRDAIGATGALIGDKKSYQINSANSDEALNEVAIDLQEGADMVMVKPGMPYLDICKRIKDTFMVPTFAYQVSGEYAMMKAASEKGFIDLDSSVLESILSFKRAGCDGVLTYFAPRICELLR